MKEREVKRAKRNEFDDSDSEDELMYEAKDEEEEKEKRKALIILTNQIFATLEVLWLNLYKF